MKNWTGNKSRVKKDNLRHCIFLFGWMAPWKYILWQSWYSSLVNLISNCKLSDSNFKKIERWCEHFNKVLHSKKLCSCQRLSPFQINYQRPVCCSHSCHLAEVYRTIRKIYFGRHVRHLNAGFPTVGSQNKLLSDIFFTAHRNTVTFHNLDSHNDSVWLLI